MIKPKFKILTGLCVIGGGVFAWHYANTVRSPLPAPLVCDFTKMANQSPEFVEHYLGSYMQPYGPQSKVEAGSDQPLEVQSYNWQGKSDNGAGTVSVSVIFYRGKVAKISAYFPEPLSRIEAARRVGLNLTAFQPDAKSGYTEGDSTGSFADYSVYSGKCKGVHVEFHVIMNIELRKSSLKRVA